MARQTFAAWETIFSTKNFDISKDLHFITPNEIKEITGLEPRIMAKMDNSSDLPPIFRKNGYFLLSIGKKGYAIVRGNGFHELEKMDFEAEEYTSRIKFNLTTSTRTTGESQYLDYCTNSGLTEHVIGDGTLYPSIRGREGSGSFSFNVGEISVDVESAMIEVDLGLEGENKIVLMEAKSQTPNDFIIRQLYYPYRRFKKISNKEINPIFFTYDKKNDLYNYWVYKFNDLYDYNSIQLVSKSTYKIITANEVEIEELKPSADVKYKDLIPQANDLDKVMELVFKVNEGVVRASSIASYFDFDSRQSSYYREAAEALGFVYIEGSQYRLTETGRYLVSLNTEDRNIFFSQVISDFSLVKDAIDLLKNKGVLTKKDIESIIDNKSNLTGTTIGRRADSLIAWLKWISQKTGTFIWSSNIFKLDQNPD